MSKYQGTGAIAASDYHSIKWVGETKGGNALTITMPEALNMGNIDWAFAEKGETVGQIVFTAVYDNTDEMSTDTTEPWTIEIDGSQSAGASEIIMGAGIFYVDNIAVALTRGGGSFNVARTFRNINADGDRGPVKGRVTIDDSTATMTLNVLTMLTNIAKLYPAMETIE